MWDKPRSDGTLVASSQLAMKSAGRRRREEKRGMSLKENAILAK